MRRFYRRRVKNPCARCSYQCETDCIKCIVCNKWVHRKCLKMTKYVFDSIDKDNFLCCKKCEFSKFPFSSVGDKEFIRTNRKISRFPCMKCVGECNKKYERLQCAGCSRWLHLECSSLPREEYGKHISSNTGSIYHCSLKCELKLLPFFSLDEFDFVDYVGDGKLQYVSKKKIRRKKPSFKKLNDASAPSSLCEYLEPSDIHNVVNDTSPNDITIYHSNVCSLRKNLDKLFETFQNGTRLPDIIGVTETRLEEHLSEIDIDGYEFEPCFSPTQAGGVGVYVANYLEYSVRRDLALNLDHCEDLWIEICTHAKTKHTKFKDNKKIVVGIIYRHPGSQYKRFCETLCKNIDTINKSNKNFVIMGDVNVNLNKYNVVGTVTDYLQSIEGAGCLSFIDKATRVVKRLDRWETSCIDHLYSNIEPVRMHSYVVTSDVSDHFSTLAKIVDANAINILKRPIFRRKKILSPKEKNNFNLELNFLLNRHGCFDPYSPYTVNEKTAFLISTYESLIDKYMPLKKLSQNKKKMLLKPWITSGIRKSIAVRDKLRKRSIKTKSDEVYKLYKFYRNKITHMKRLSFNTYYKEKLQNSFGNKRKEWEIVNQITRYKKKKKTEINSLKDEKNEILRNECDIANGLNKHFNSIGQKMANKFPNSNQERYKAVEKIERTVESIYLRRTTIEEIEKLIDKLKSNKAPGIDGISNYIIKSSTKVISLVLMKLFNQCMEEGIFPDVLKIACIVPLYKGGEKNESTNYRPISLLPLFGKIFEKIIESRLVKFFDKKKIITPHQFGFRKYYSTELAVTEIQNMLLKNLDENKVTCTIFLDLAKAFDTVDHGILLLKLEKYGIRGQALTLLKSYLQDRQHAVKLNNVQSSFLTLNIGVPQGSVLGPLLFLLFINDLPNYTNFNVKLFADDTFLSLESKNLKDLEKKVNEEMKNISEWLTINKLTLNVSKTKYMLISNRKKLSADEFYVKFDNVCFEKCSSYKYLGVFLDDKLCWKPHIDYISNKISKMCGIFSKLRYATNFHLLKSVYFALVASHLQYCNLVWGNAAQSILDPLKKIQNRIIRILSFAPFNCHNIKILYEDLQILNLEQIHKLAKGKFVYKYKDGKLPSNFENYLVRTNDVHNHNLRSSSLSSFVKVGGRTSHSLKMIQYDAVKVWESIPNEIKKMKNSNEFCENYKCFLLNGVF